MRNYSDVLKAQTIETESAGLAQRRYAIYSDNLEAATNRLTAAWEKLYASTLNSGIVKTFVDLSASLLGLIEKFGLFNVIIVVVSGIISGKLLVNIPLLTTAFLRLAGAQGVATLATTTLASALSGGLVAVAIIGVIAILGELNKSILQTYANFEKLKAQTDDNQKELRDLAKEYEDLANKQNKSADDITRLLDIQTILNTKYGALSDGVNSYTDAINGNSTAIQKNIQWMKDQADRQAQNFIDQEKYDYEKAKKYLTTPPDSEVAGMGIFTPEDYVKSLDEMIAKQGDLFGLTRKQRDEVQRQVIAAQNLIIEYEHYKNLLSREDTSSQGYFDEQYIDRTPVIEKEIETFQDLQKELDKNITELASFNSQMQSLIDSYDEYGQLGLDQVEQLKKALGEEYINYLYVENGQIKLNTEALRQLGIQKALDNYITAVKIYTTALDTEGITANTEALKNQVQVAQAYYDQVVSGTSLSVTSIQNQKKAYQDLLKIVMDMIKSQKEAEKQALQDSLKEYKDNIDARMEALKDQAEAEKQRLQDQLEGYKKIIDAEKDLLRQKQKDADFQDELANKNKEISDIDAELLAIRFDTSESANARRLELEAQRAQKTKELNKFVADKGVDDAVDALDREYAQFEEQNQRKQTLIERNFEAAQKALEADYKAFEKSINDKIKVIDEYLRQSGTMTADAMQMLKSRTDSFYQSLIEWNKRFGSSVQEDVIKMLETAFRIKVQLGQGGGVGEGGGDRKRDYTLDRTTQRYINKYTGKSLSQEEWQALPYHKGGVVGGEMPKLPGSEVLARLLKGEQISTDSMLSNFMMRTLPQIVANVGGKSEGIGKLELNVNVAGNLDRAVLPDLQSAVLTIVNNAFKERGVKRGAFSYSSG